jgi:hypothetical protein
MKAAAEKGRKTAEARKRTPTKEDICDSKSKLSQSKKM